MFFEAFKELVDEIKKDHPFWFGMDSDNKPDVDTVNDAERKIRAQLPNEYKDFIFEYGGGYFAFSNVYSLEAGSDWNLVDVNLKYDVIRKGYVLISENGSGDFYGFKVVDGVCDPKVYFYDHEVDRWYESPYNNLFDYLKIFALTN